MQIHFGINVFKITISGLENSLITLYKGDNICLCSDAIFDSIMNELVFEKLASLGEHINSKYAYSKKEVLLVDSHSCWVFLMRCVLYHVDILTI